MPTRRNLLSASVWVVALGILVNLAWLGREKVIANLYGVGDVVDVFYLGLALPLYAAGLVGACVSSAVIPAFTAARQQGKTNVFLGEVFWLLMVFVLAIMGLCAALGWWITPWMAKGFAAGKIHMALQATVLLVPIVVLHAMGSLWESIFNCEQKYAISTGSNVLLPLGVVGCLLVWPQGNVIALITGVYAGYAMRLVVLGWFLPKEHRPSLWPPPQDWQELMARHRVLVREFFLMIFAASIMGLLPVIGQGYAASLPAGSVAINNYANKVVSAAVSLMAMAINALVLPLLAQLQLESSRKAANQGYRLCLLALVGCLGLAVPGYFLLKPVVWLLFGGGAFTAADGDQVARLLVYYIPYVPLYVCGLILARIVVSIGVVRIFLWSNSLSLLVYWAVCHVLVPAMGLNGLAIALSVVYATSCIYLLIAIEKSLKSTSLAQGAP